VRFGLKLAGLFILFGLVPLLVVSHFAYQRSQGALIEQARRHVASLSVLKVDELLKWMTGNTSLLESVANRPHLADAAGQLLTVPRGSDERTALRGEIVAEHLDPNTVTGGIDALQILHPETGQILAATDPRLEGRFRESDPFFLEGRAGTFVGRVEYQVAQEQLVMHVSTPIRAADGSLLAVLAAHVDLAEMGRIIRLSSGAHDSEDTYVINDFSFFVTEPRFGDGYALRRALHSDGAEAAVRGEIGVAEYADYRGVLVVGAYRWIEELALGLLVEIDWAEITEPVRAISRMLIIIAIAVGVLVLVAAILLSRGAVQPIRRLIGGTREIGRGNLGFRIDVRGRDEIAQLGRSFNRMTDDLQTITASRDELNREIARREAAEKQQKIQWDRFAAILEGFPDVMYVSDPDTYEVLFVNGAFEQLLGHNPVGESCYEALHGLHAPCDFCTNPIIRDASEPHTWEHYNPVLSRHFLVTDRMIRWPDGRHVRFEVAKDVTEVKRLEEEKDRLSQYFANILDNGEIWMHVADADGNILEWNRGAEAISGYSHDAIVGHDRIWTLLYPVEEDREDLLGRIRRMGATDDQAFLVETEVVCKGGSRRTILWNSHALRGIGGEIAGIVTIGRDVTEERRALEAARREKEITDSVIESLPGIFYQIDADGRMVRWNHALERVLGYADTEITDMPPVDLFDRDDRAAVAETIEKVFAEGAAELAAELATKSGERIPYLLTGTLMTIDGTPQLIGMGTDISALRMAEAAVRESEEKFRGLFENVRIGMFRSYIDDGTLIDVNETMARIFGTTREDLMGRPGPDVWVDPREREAVMDRLRRERELTDLEVELRTEGGVRKTVLETMRLSEDGTIVEGSITDITPRVEAERRLQRTLVELERSNQELEQFAYVASHDLQEPLRMVASYTQLLERRYRDALDDDARDFIGYAVDGANRMQRLINDLLAFSRVQTRGKPFEPVDLNSALGRARANLAMTVDETGAVVSNAELPTVSADEGQLVSVFQNLIGNGIKFRGEEAPRVHVSAVEREAEWEISVRDNGIGISPEFHDRIFVIFQRLHGRTEYEGTGIGLAMAKRIVERHGGSIWVDSKPGDGATFRFTLPKRTKEVG
jgi:PAS domain S-box-containing protein